MMDITTWIVVGLVALILLVMFGGRIFWWWVDRKFWDKSRKD